MAASSTMRSAGSILPLRMSRALLVVCWLSVVYGTSAAIRHAATLQGVAAWISTLVFLVAFTVAVERPDSAVAVLLLIGGLAGVAMQALASSNGAYVAVIGVIAVAGIRLDPVTGRRLAALISIGFLAVSALGAHPLANGELISIVPALFFTYLGATAMRRLRAEQQRTEELLEEVIAGRDARIRAAALDERARLAREMHDVLAHTLSALSIQLEGTRMMAEQGSCEPKLLAALERAGGLAREGLGEARRAVGSLRGEVLPGPDLLPQLAAEFESDTGVPCRLRVEGQPVELGAEARLALYRIAQEALTNVRKHVDASAVDIIMCYGAESIELIVEDKGVLLDSPLPSGGYGLSGMRERAELLEGKLEAGPTQTGFRVSLWMPTWPNSRSVS